MKNPKINLIIFGENASLDIHNIITKNMSFEKYQEYDCQKFIDNNGKMDFFIFQNKFEEKTIDKTFKNIEKMLKDHYKTEVDITFLGKTSLQKRKILRDVLIFIVDKLEDKNAIKIIKKFEKFSNLPSKQPFMLFLTKQENNPDIESLWDSITNSNLDKRNLFALKFPQNYNDKEEILNLLNYFFDYYHDCYSSKNNFASLNLLICGIAGTGKSTLLNQIQKKKLAKEGDGLSVSTKIIFFSDNDYNINRIDSPGFEDEATVENIIKLIENIEENMKTCKEHIDCIIYLTKNNERTFFEIEKKIIKFLAKKNIEIIFCINTHGIKENSDEYWKKEESYKDSLETILNEEEGNISEEKIEKILDNMIFINLVPKNDTKAYGLEKLFKKLYENLKNKKINIEQLENNKNLKDFLEAIQKYSLLKIFTRIKDFQIKNRINLSKDILESSKSDHWWTITGLMGRGNRRKELLKKIAKTYGENNINEDEVYNQIESKLQYQNLTEVQNNFFESIKDYKDFLDSNGFPFDAYWYNEKTLAMGYTYMKEFEKDSFLLEKNLIYLILNYAKALNKGIEDLRILSEEWESIYHDIDKGESDKGWVRRFFNLKKKSNE